MKNWLKTKMNELRYFRYIDEKLFTRGLLVMLGGVTIGLLMSLLLQVV